MNTWIAWKMNDLWILTNSSERYVENVLKMSKICKNHTILVSYGSVCTYCIIIHFNRYLQQLLWYSWVDRSWNVDKNQYFGLFFQISQLWTTKTARRTSIFNRFRKFFQFFHQNNIPHQISWVPYVFEDVPFLTHSIAYPWIWIRINWTIM